MDVDEYRQHDALGLAGLVADGEVSPAELLEAAITRAEQVQPTLNPLTLRQYDRARARLDGSGEPLGDGPFRGVPFLLKDLGQAEGGVPSSYGSRAFADRPRPTDSVFVARAKAAGLNVMGRTNTPELGLRAVTEPDAFGPTRNPWDPDRTPGGSSGGSGAAVAAEVVPMAGAGDGGGSIRIPAAYCGLVGLKPSRGRTSLGPSYGNDWEGAVAELVVSRSVRDTAAFLDAVAGTAPGDPYAAPPRPDAFLAQVTTTPRRLRVGWTTTSPLGTPVDAECVAAVERTVTLLTDLGHEVAESPSPVDGDAVARSYVTMYLGQVAATVDGAIADGIDEDRFEPDTRLLAKLGRALSASVYAAELLRWNDYARSLAGWFTEHDLSLSPTTAMLPARIGELDPPAAMAAAMEVVRHLPVGKLVLRSGMLDQIVTESLQRTPFTQLANLTGTPSISLPLHQSAGGLPVGVQFTAPFGDEATLLQLAGQLESAAPWAARRPPA